MRTLIKRLREPYPVNVKKWPMIISISCFIGLFLMMFQPFGLQFVEDDNKSLILFGYGVITFIILTLNILVLPLIFPKYFDEKNWTVGKQILWLNIDVLMIAVGNYFYSVVMLVFPWVAWEGMITFIGFTLPIGMFPAVILTFLQQNRLLKQNLKSSSEINAHLHPVKLMENEKAEVLSVKSGTQIVTFNPSEIVYIESEGNYLNIHHIKDELIGVTQIRMTLKSMDDLIDVGYLLKCHRAFIVNLNYIQRVDGNSQGYTLSLKNTETQIPVSRSFIPRFKERMEQL